MDRGQYTLLRYPGRRLSAQEMSQMLWLFFCVFIHSFPYAHAKKKISTNGLSVPQPHEPIISSPDWLGAGCSEDTSSNPTSTTRSHHSLTRREVFQNLANRIIYSKFYMVLYLVLAVLSVWSIFLSFNQGCASSPLFVILESIINCSMIAEVGLRLTALGKVRKSQIVPTLGSDDSYHNYSTSFFLLSFVFLPWNRTIGDPRPISLTSSWSSFASLLSSSC